MLTSHRDLHDPLLQAFPFVHAISAKGSSRENQCYFASATYWYLNGTIDAFNGWSAASQRYVGSHFDRSRRYYWNERLFAKVFLRAGSYAQINAFDIAREADFLIDYRDVLKDPPQLIFAQQNEHECWLVREKIHGELLLEVMHSAREYDSYALLREILLQLVALEQRNLYHSDLRTWNVLIRPDNSAILIDYGAIISIRKNCHWPSNIFLAFWIFVWSVTTRTPIMSSAFLPPQFRPSKLPRPFQTWAYRFWNIEPTAWSFQRILALLESEYDKAPLHEETQLIEVLMQDLEGRITS